jgi:adenosylmethionine-8-amino-7-oxononanoate aminotransferase
VICSNGEMPSRFLHPFARPTREDFVTIVRGEGALVYDAEGNDYVDGMASLWYVNVGHGRGEVADAAAAQMRTLAAYSCFDPFTNEPAERVAERLAGYAAACVDDPRVFFTSSGSEAVDSAIKLSRIAQLQAGHPERTKVISRSFGYHGVTYGGLSAQGLPPNQAGFGPLLEGFLNVPHHDAEAVGLALEANAGEVAAVITEPVQGAGGVHPPVEGYLAELRRLCDRHGAHLIVDEVICAFGRLGRWFASEHYGIRPDLVSFAKGVTSGYVPLGGVVVGKAVRDALEADPAFWLRHGHTYSGHPTACVAAEAVLDITEREDLLGRSDHVGGRLSAGLRSLAADGLVAQVRGAGAVWAVAVHAGTDPIAVRDRMMANGVITRAVGTDTLTFCPPLVITDAQIDRIVDALAASLPV